MLFKLTRFIDEAAQNVPALLWSPAAVARMKALVERFPEVETRTIGPVRLGVFGLEFRLAPEAEQVDLTFPLLGEDRDVLVHHGDDEAAGRWLREDPVWSRIWRLCGRWAEPETLLGRYVERLWLELDIRGEPPEGTLPAPGIFVGLKPETTAEASPETWRQLVTEVLELLAGQPPEPALLGRFEGCVRSLPAGAFVQYLGLMLSRGGGTVRFVFAKLAEAELPRFLTAVGWPGPIEELPAVLADLITAGGETLHPGASALQLDIGPAGVLPGIGLEYVLDRSVQAEGRIGEQRFFEHLVDRNLCSAEKLAALTELPGRTLEPWRGICQVGHSRQIHHVKLALGPRGPSQAKAYYGRSLLIQPLEGGAGPEG